MPITIAPDAVEFFIQHAGYSHNSETETPEEGQRRGAQALAEAEAWAKQAGVTFAWEDDWEIGNHKDFYGEDSAYADAEPDTCEHATAYFEGEVVAGLSCIDDATPEYRRVVEAELADEARSELFAPKVTPLLQGGPQPSTLEAVRAGVFGVLINLAMPVLKGFFSDLYHDATWLGENVSGPMVFFYDVDQDGTSLVLTDEDIMRPGHAWRVEITHVDDKWAVSTTRLF